MSKVTNYSENEDDPEVYESSGDEWNSSSEKTSNNRRSSQRLSKKPRIAVVEDESSSSSESSDDEPRRRKPKNGWSKKQKVSDPNTNSTSNSNPNNTTSNTNSNTTSPSSDSAKPVPAKDAQVGDPSKHPCIWRIDGKALLQKYEAFDEAGKVRHKNTSIYTGWSPMDKDLYAPITVDVIHHNNQNLTVELHWDKLKDVNMDSD
ncbi:hypothetical protein NQ314_017172 [Rhamnusium bicolor]|uniref:Uncharacterized protein n=1 Tax=Rhamnusium bicolor TaxID=1586634 RepID=A0AAV8WUZ9_9CUCU|nr:hypothetical protein NQ314_017172 [Rhamnusium bicolor]